MNRIASTPKIACAGTRGTPMRAQSSSRRLAASSLALVLLAALVPAGCATSKHTPAPAEGEASAQRPKASTSYLSKEQLPDNLALLPPPPEPGSTASAHDEEIHRQATALRGTPRWDLAVIDAEIDFPHTIRTFECALGVGIDPAHTPRLQQLLQKSMIEAAVATGTAKRHYKRTRPFVAHDESTCDPKHEDALRKDGSYPSGHTALGWAGALVLAELAPDRADALLARGRSYGESRLVCNAHWQSDVVQGRIVASATVARLHAVPEFVEDMKLAKAELDAARVSGIATHRDCTAEAQALALTIPGVL